MSSRVDDRNYKVVYEDRGRGAEDYGSSRPARRQPDYERDYGYDRSYSRDPRDERRGYQIQDRERDTRTLTKTQYEIGRDRNSDAYVKRSNALVIGPNNSRSEFEVLRPERRPDGSYVVDTGMTRGYDDRDRRYEPKPRYYDEGPSQSTRNEIIMYDSPRAAGRTRGVSNADYRDVQVMEDIVSDSRYARRDRQPEIVPEEPLIAPTRIRSSMRGRNDSPPEEWTRRRGQSVGFYQDQIERHDASESRHERPGAEAHLSGRYLHKHRDGRDNDDDDIYEDTTYYERRKRTHGERSRSRGGTGGHGQRRSYPRLAGDDYDDERHEYTEQTMRQYDYEEARPLYPEQQERKRRHHHHHSHRSDGRDDDRSTYSEYEAVTRKTKDYY